MGEWIEEDGGEGREGRGGGGVRTRFVSATRLSTVCVQQEVREGVVGEWRGRGTE